jgi:hypothetical protein
MNQTDVNELALQLKQPFSHTDIEFRAGAVSETKKKVQALAYVTARGIMNRLDEVFGIDGWYDNYEVMKNGVKCKLTVKIGENWITKEDGASFTSYEPFKGGFSDALKRTAVKYGIGRYLYDLPNQWVAVSETRPSGEHVNYLKSEKLCGYWIEPLLPQWALPTEEKQTELETLQQQLSTQLSLLMQTGKITKTNAEYFSKVIAKTKTITGLQSVQVRFQLLEQLYQKANLLKQPERNEIYKQIISGAASKLAVLSHQIEHLGKQEAA